MTSVTDMVLEFSQKSCKVAIADFDGSATMVLATLALATGLPMLPGAANPSAFCDFLLFYKNACLCLQSTEEGAAGAVCVDFEDESLQYRQRRPAKPEALLKAAGVKQGQTCHVLDATAGLGLDAFLFACAGAQVTLVERSPILHAMLADGLARGASSEDERVRCGVARMQLVQGDSACVLKQYSNASADVVYLDPMFPERKNSAKVKKNMFLLQQLLDTEPQAERLLTNALRVATKRVVVKRPRHAQFLEQRKPSFSQEMKSSRFDVYLCTPNP